MSKPAKQRNSTGTPLFCVRFFIFLLVVGLCASSYYFNKSLTELSTALSAETNHLSVLQKQVNDQQVIINRFNQSVTNADVQKQLNNLEASLLNTQHEMNVELESTETNIKSLLNSTLNKLDKTVSEAQSEIQSEVNIVKADVEQYVRTTQDQFSMENSFMVYQLAGTFTLLACLISMYHMTSHIRFFNRPFVQRKILAILWMSPIYSLTSWLSLVFPKYEGYLSIVKDFYEAYVVYQFLSFLISVLGAGDRDKVVELLSQHASHLEPPMRICGWCRGKYPFTSNKSLANAVLLQCQVFAMQFVFLKPLTAIAMFTCNKLNYYGEGTGPSDYRSPQFWILVVQNISVFMAFSGLIKFYHAVQDDLAWCRPFPKFLCIKGIVFMTFWQGLVISLLASTTGFGGNQVQQNDDDNSNDPDIWGKQAQNFLVCLEMLLFSIAHFYCFPTEEWDPEYRPLMEKKSGVGELAFGDFVSDLKLIFSGDLKKAVHTKTNPKSPKGGAEILEIADEEIGIEKDDMSTAQELDDNEEDKTDTDMDQPLDLEHQLVTSICHGLSSEDPEIREAANRVVQSMQVMKGENGDDTTNEAFYDAETSDTVGHHEYGSTSDNSLRSREYETFNPLQSFPGMTSIQSLDKKNSRNDTPETEQTSSFLLNPLHTFVNDDGEEDAPSSETTSLLTKRKNDDDDDVESKNTSNVALRPSIFTKHD